MKFTRIFVVCAGVGLSACSSGSTVTTQRYAQPGDAIGPGSTFAQQDVKRFVRVNGTQSLKDQTISIRFSDDGQTAYINQNYKDFTLLKNAAGDFVSLDGLTEYIPEKQLSNVVETGFFQTSVGSGYYSGGYFLIGYKTDPAQISPTTRGGSASYLAETGLSFRTDTQTAFGDGVVTLTANFATRTLTGAMYVTDDPGAGGSVSFDMPDTLITINPSGSANISGNQFTSDLSIAVLLAPGDTMSVGQTGLTGNFYGVDAASAGATYWATGTFNGENLYIEGALASD